MVLPEYWFPLSRYNCISKIVICLVLSFFPLKVHTPKSLGIGVFAIILSAVIFTSPHFLYDPGLSGWRGNATEYKDDNRTESHRNSSNETYKIKAIFFFLLTQILHGIGGGLYLTQGKSYKDENIHLHLSPSLISLLSILKTLGPAFGYWLSSVCLKTHASLDKAYNENETPFIGAWWLGNLVIGFILFVVGFLLILFPPTMPKAAVRRIFSNIGGDAEVEQNFTAEGITKPIKSLFIASSFNSTHFSGTFKIVGFMAYFIFLPKYVEIQYRISASAANLLAGSVTLISAAFGIVMASSVITRYRLNVRAFAGWTVTVGVLSACGLIFYTYLGCTENDAQIKAVASHYSTLENSCDCGFHPICVASQIILSPCHFDQDGIFHNGTKIHKSNSQTLKDKGLITSLCPVNCYPNFLLFIIVTCSVTFIYATGQASSFWFEIKRPYCTFKSHSMRLHFITILVFVPAPIIFGYILDKNCLLWDDNCTKTGNCWLYNNENLRYIMNFTAVCFAIIGIIFNVGVWYSIKNLTSFYDHDDDYTYENES